MARPKAVIDEDAVAQMAFDGAKNSVIAAILGVDDETIKNRFSPILAKKRAERKLNILRKQNERADRGDTAILIWLGKNELDQTDRQVLEHSGAIKTGDKLTIEVIHTRPVEKGGGNDGNGDEKK